MRMERDRMHLDRAQIERALDSEHVLDPDLRDHLMHCAECRARLAEAELQDAWLRQRLSVLDRAAPEVRASDLMRRARSSHRGRQRLAAGILLAVLAGGVAYAAPGLPGAINRLVALIHPTPRRPGDPSPRTDQPVSPAGIAVSPGERLTVEFESPGSADTAVVVLTDSAELMVRGSGGTITFSSEPDRLVVRHQGAPARYQVLIPRTAPSITLRAGTQRLWGKTGARIEASARPGKTGGYLLPLSQDSALPAP